jgi:O-antigen/teichoic acid export membrane protein
VGGEGVVRLRELLGRVRAEGAPRAALVTTGGTMLGALAAFVAAIFAARSLSAPEFAVFGVGLAVNSLGVQLADLGVGVAAVAETAADWEQGARRETYAKLRRLAAHRLLSALATAALVTGIALVVPDLEPYRGAVAIGAGGAVIWSLAFFAVSALQAGRRFEAGATVVAGLGVVRMALVGIAAIEGAGGDALLALYAIAAPALGLVLALALLAVRRPVDGPAGAANAARADFRGPVAVAAVAAALLLNVDVPLLVLLTDQDEVATYAAAWRVAAGLMLLNTAIAQALLPYIVLGDDPWAMARRLSRAGILMSAGWLVLVPAITVAGVWILGQAGDDAAAPLALLLAAFAIQAYISAVYQVYLRVGRARVVAVAVVVELGVMIAVTVLLRAEGALAPAVGQLAAAVVGATIVGMPIALAAAGRLAWFTTAESPAWARTPPPSVSGVGSG